MARVKKLRDKKQIVVNNEKSTWENTAKEQPYLMPGTAEYEERVADLQANSAEAPDDVFHEKLEDHNAAVPSNLKQRHTKHDPNTQRRWRERVKEDMYESVSNRLQREAAMTETLSDDKMVGSMRRSDFDDYTTDPTLYPDDYEKSIVDDLF